MTAALKNHNDMHPAFPALWVVGTLRLLAVAALSFACFLAWSAYQAGDIAGCSGGGVWDCSHVLHSKWAKWMSIPVSVPAAALYASMIVSLLFVGEGVPSNVRRMAWRIVTTLAFAAALSAVWFVYLQVFVLEHLCKYCLVVHGCGVAIALLALVHRPFNWAATGRMVGLAATGAAVLILGQVFGKAPENFAIDVHEPVVADHSLADFDAPADEDDFSSPIEDVAVDDVFAAPEEDVFDAPVIEETRPISTTAPNETLPEQSDSTSLPSNPSPREVFADAPLQFQPLKVVPKTRTYHRYVQRVPFEEAAPFNPLRESFDEDDADAGSTNPFATSTQRVPTPTLSPQPPVVPAVPSVEPAQPTVTPEASQIRPASNVELVQLTAEKKKRLVRYPGADVNLNVANWPILGSDQAPHIVVELFDYTCPYCRTMHKHITEARRRFGNQIAFIVMPVPLSGQCNPTVTNTSAEHAEACEIATLALGVWRCNAKAFPEYHEWLMAGDRTRTAAEARQHAEQLVDANQLRTVMAKPILSKFIDRHVALYKRSGEGTLPKLLTERVTVRGKMNSAEQLCATLAANLQLNQ